MFIDQAIIVVRSGKGGDGSVHFRREKFVPRGGPDGGDGGKGGDVILEVVSTLNTLSSFRHKNQFRAQGGARGGKSNMTGRSGEDLIISVPPGTIGYDDDTGDVIGDLVDTGQRLTVVKGGRGGRGNARFKSSTNQVPKIAERGEPFQERNLRLELKLIADVGIIGAPNAGKSTLLSAVSQAKPKIAAYPFTTLVPNLGVATLDPETTLVLADIPGLIEGAHQGIGLGHDFLRHIQRTRVLIHLLDGLAEDPILDYAQINTELALFDPDLAKKPQIVALNKMDLPDVQARWPEVEAGLQEQELKIQMKGLFAISAVAGTNVRELLYRVAQVLDEIPYPAPVIETPVYRLDSDPREFEIKREAAGWRVSGESIERAAAMTYWEHFQSVRRFQRIMETLGIDQALREAGVQVGDTVFIGENDLEWQE
ncbi:MAG: GTPase ObgE [Chloroflexota bacterium]|nr:GTPase ObgE [Chloroflexota bacterium]